MSTATGQRRDALPILYTSGTYYQVGHDVGRTFRSLITDFLASIKDQHAALLAKYSDGEGKIIYDNTMATLKENFPHYVRELQGTADGARVPFYHLMVLHVTPLTEDCHDLGTASGSSQQDAGVLGPSFGCSSVSLNMEDEVLLGHTEDAQAELTNNIYLVSAHILEEAPQGRWRTREERFTSLCYAGFLPGFCMSYNTHGLVCSINIISPLTIFGGRTRALLPSVVEVQLVW